MDYANGGDLHKYLQKDFTNITWDKKLHILWKISMGYLHLIYQIIFIDYHFNANILLF